MADAKKKTGEKGIEDLIMALLGKITPPPPEELLAQIFNPLPPGTDEGDPASWPLPIKAALWLESLLLREKAAGRVDDDGKLPYVGVTMLEAFAGPGRAADLGARLEATGWRPASMDLFAALYALGGSFLDTFKKLEMAGVVSKTAADECQCAGCERRRAEKGGTPAAAPDTGDPVG